MQDASGRGVVARAGPVRVAILGGGMAGISAARTLQAEARVAVTLFEKEGRLGGQAQVAELPPDPARGRNVAITVDLGPQYCTRSGWPEYLDLLYTTQVDGQSLHDWAGPLHLRPTISVVHEDGSRPPFATPELSLAGLGTAAVQLRAHGPAWLSENAAVFQMISALHELYLREPEVDRSADETAEALLARLEVSDEARERVLGPTLSGFYGTRLSQLPDLHARAVSEVTGRQSALRLSRYTAFERGMGAILERLGEALEPGRVERRLGAEVVGLDAVEGGWRVRLEDGSSAVFDQVIAALQPVLLLRMMEDGPLGAELGALIGQYRCPGQRIVIHDDDAAAGPLPAFLNMRVRGDAVRPVMRLDLIHPSMRGLYKAWVDDRDMEDLERGGRILAQQTFLHVQATVSGVVAGRRLRALLAERAPGLHVAGGWLSFETQETALQFGRLAARAVLKALG